MPDDVVVGIVSEAMEAPECKKGFILDGFPRTTAQAEKVKSCFLFFFHPWEDSRLEGRVLGRSDGLISSMIWRHAFGVPWWLLHPRSPSHKASLSHMTCFPYQPDFVGFVPRSGHPTGSSFLRGVHVLSEHFVLRLNR